MKPLYRNVPRGLAIGISLALLTVHVFAVTAHAERPAIRTIVHTDYAAPGLDDTVRLSTGTFHYWGLGGPSSAFAADIAGADPRRMIWHQDALGQTRFVVGEGDTAPGMPDGTYFDDSFWYVTLNANGDVAFTGNTAGTLPGRGIWASRNGALEVVAATGQAVPGMSGRKFQTAELSSINDSGHVAISAWINPISIAESPKPGIWSEGGGNGLELLAAHGLPVPNLSNATFDNLGHPLINAQGQTAFYASMNVGAPLNRGSIWTGTNYNNIRKVVATEDPYPALPGGIFAFLGGYPDIDSSGAVVFSGNVYSPSTGQLSGIWRATDSGLEELVRQDTITPYPDNPDIQFTGIGESVLSENGAIAFSAGITGPGVHYIDSNDGIWFRSPTGEIRLIAREGDVPPGWGTDEKLELFFGPEPSINARGQVAFRGYFRRPGLEPYLGEAILATDANGQLQTLVRTGDTIDLDNGPGVDLRTIAGIGFYSSGSNTGGFTSAFNDQGEAMFQAIFTDGSFGFFKSTLVAVPEPCGPALVIPIVTALGSRRTRKRR